MLEYSLGLACPSDGGRGGADSNRRINKTERSPHVAFGSRVPLPLSTVHINTNLPNDDGNTGCSKERQLQTPHMHGRSTKSSSHKSPEMSGQEICPETIESKTPFPQNKVGTISHCRGMLSEEVLGIASSAKEARQTPLENKFRGCNTLSNYKESAKPEEAYKEQTEHEKSPVDKCKRIENNNHGLQKSQRSNKKKEEPQLLTNIKSFKKENKTKEFKHTNYADSPPGSPPCGWEGCSSSGASSQGFSSFSKIDECQQAGEATNGLSKDTKIPIDSPKYRNTDRQSDISQTGKTGAGLTVQQLSSLHFLKRKHGRGILNLPIASGSSHRYDLENNDLAEDRDFHFTSDDELSEVQSIGSGCSGATADLRASLDCSHRMPEEITHPARELERDFQSVKSAGPKELPPQGEQVVHDPYEEELWVVHEENVITEYKESASESALNEPAVGEADVKKEEGTEGNQVSVPSFGYFQSAKSEIFDCKSIPNDSHLTNYGEDQPKLIKEPNKGLSPSKFENEVPKIQPNVTDRGVDEDLDLLYDPTMDCYYDPKTNRYYELEDSCI